MFWILDFQNVLLFADAGQAKLLIQSLDGSNSESIAIQIPQYFNILRPSALDLDIKNNRIYWTDITLHTISSVFINGSSPEVLVSKNVSAPWGLAVDPLGGNIYWTDSGTDKIEVSKLDGSMRKMLIDQNLDRPRDIILDLNRGWTWLLFYFNLNSYIILHNVNGEEHHCQFAAAVVVVVVYHFFWHSHIYFALV